MQIQPILQIGIEDFVSCLPVFFQFGFQTQQFSRFSRAAQASEEINPLTCLEVDFGLQQVDRICVSVESGYIKARVMIFACVQWADVIQCAKKFFCSHHANS
ncbi:hypothetical protein C8246_08845 [Paracidovorax avenae]|nr:hypothetical protein C8246_08845 [Paracidovorax avenae]AVT05394.1 hypothetical protein C8248_04935 [Paracidovorax avenae]AVT19590.1 hypothetical protein C7Y68_05835 [Paracidovorax avenae]